MKTKELILIVLIIILTAVASGLGVYVYFQRKSLPVVPEQQQENNLTKNVMKKKNSSSEDSQQLIGGDKDEHGCLVGAGYSWCEEKNKCLRTWEENCEPKKEEVKKEVSTEEGIISALAKKYNKKEKEVTINISKEEGNYARGEVTLAPGGPGNSGMFLTKKINGEWEIIHDGNGLPDCDKLIKEHHPPKSMIGDLCGN